MAQTLERKTISTQFQHEHLEKGGIRLIRILPSSTASNIHCSIEHRKDYASDISNEEAYTALSYCWGDPSRTKNITLNGLPFPVTASLWQALSTIYQHHDKSAPFWIDAICINQADVEERNYQVSQMRQIFSKAGRTYAWVGQEDEHTRLALKGLRQIHNECCEEEKAKEGGSDFMLRIGCACLKRGAEHHRLTPRAAMSVLSLAGRPYFSRVWIRPEYLQPRIYNLHILCGSYSIDAITFNHGLYNTIPPHASLALPEHVHEMLFQRNAPDSWNMGWPHCSPPYKFRHVLGMFARCGCTDPRDRIFAMCGDDGLQQVCQPGEQLGPDYRWSVDELILVVLSFYDTLLLSPEYNPNLSSKSGPESVEWLVAEKRRVFQELMRLLALLGDALGAPKGLVELREWVFTHVEWVRSWEEQGTVVLSTGRKVDCGGPTLNLIVNERDYTGEGEKLGPDVIKIGFPNGIENGGWEITEMIE